MMTQSPVHPLYAGFRRRIERAARPEEATEWVWLEAASASPGAVTVISSELDPTSRHVCRVALSWGRPLAWVTYEAVLRGDIDFAEAVSAMRTSRGIYMRHPVSGEQDIVTVAACLESHVETHPNVIRESTRSSNWSKPLHGKVIRKNINETNIRMPDSIVTNYPQKTNETVCKGISYMPTHVYQTVEKYLNVTNGPYYIQERIHGDEIRVHVLENEVFPVKIRTDKSILDYRLAPEFHFDYCSLPEEVIQFLVRATRNEGLRFSGVDLIHTKTDEYHVMEVNPMPGFHCYEEGPEYLVTRALLRCLQRSGADEVQNIAGRCEAYR